VSDIWPDCMHQSADIHGMAFSCKGYGALLAERDALARDAARYRWLRDRWFIAGEMFPDELHEGATTAGHFDDAIDARLTDSADADDEDPTPYCTVCGDGSGICCTNPQADND
jgi:hypothetical protein